MSDKQYVIHDRARFVGDSEATARDIAVLVASGDLFVTLATLLESVTDELGDVAPDSAQKLTKLTDNLLYLQRHYTVKPMAANFRQ